MSKTLADVEAYQVYRATDGDLMWTDWGDAVLGREANGNITAFSGSRPEDITITGPCLGHVRDEPWRNADAKQPGSLADAHNRIDAVQTTIEQLIGMARAQIQETNKLADRITSLEERPGEPVEPANQCPPPPAKPTQPPDVAVYERRTDDGRDIRDEMPAGSCTDSESYYRGFKRTVLDAFERLGWDELLEKYGITHRVLDDGTWVLYRSGFAVNRDHKNEREALTAARAIARKEGWR